MKIAPETPQELWHYLGDGLPIEILKEFIEIYEGQLYWKLRSATASVFNAPCISKYRYTCGLFNSSYAGEPVEGKTFKCCGVEHRTADVLAALEGYKT